MTDKHIQEQMIWDLNDQETMRFNCIIVAILVIFCIYDMENMYCVSVEL